MMCDPSKQKVDVDALSGAHRDVKQTYKLSPQQLLDKLYTEPVGVKDAWSALQEYYDLRPSDVAILREVAIRMRGSDLEKKHD